MALFGSSRDISMFRKVNRELLGDIITQQIAYYKYNLNQTKVNMYGENVEGKYYIGPVLLNCLLERGDTASSVDDFGMDVNRNLTVRLFKPHLIAANVEPSVGDIILWNEDYYEVNNVNENQLVVGKDPDYPYLDAAGNNPYETDLSQFGYNVSIICESHYVPSDRLNIQLSRL